MSATRQSLVVLGEMMQGRCEAEVEQHRQPIRRPGSGNGSPKLEQFKPPWNFTLKPEQAYCRG